MSMSPPPPPPPSTTPGGRLASWGSRVMAYIVDWLVTAVPVGIVVSIGVAMGSTAETTDAGFSVTGGAGAGFVFIGSVLGLAISLWNYGHKQGNTGQTVGKGLVNIEVVDKDGQYLGFWMSILRTILMWILGSICILNYLWPLWDEQDRTWHDMIMSTLVLQTSH